MKCNVPKLKRYGDAALSLHFVPLEPYGLFNPDVGVNNSQNFQF
jgi:hypothetical protein